MSSSPRITVIRPRTAVLLTAMFTLASAACVALVLTRWWWTDRPTFGFLGWNLFLAWLPYLLALAIAAAHARGVRSGWLVALGVPWLAFLPNAPYILTDVVHLRPRTGAPLWFDAVLIGSFATVGLLLGLLSVVLVHRVVAAHAGVRWGWFIASATLALSVVGVHLGRVHRFNSWDIVVNPAPLVQVVGIRLSDPLGRPELVLIGVAGTLALLASYLVVWSFLSRVRTPAA